jgi:hypothetical protein
VSTGSAGSAGSAGFFKPTNGAKSTPVRTTTDQINWHTVHLNPHPHCFKTIIKANGLWLIRASTDPTHALHRMRGGGGAFSAALKFCFKKKWHLLYIIIKSKLKMMAFFI